jgi:hypothetical protein
MCVAYEYAAHLLILFTHSILHKHTLTYRHMPHKFREAILTFSLSHSLAFSYQYLIEYQRRDEEESEHKR